MANIDVIAFSERDTFCTPSCFYILEYCSRFTRFFPIFFNKGKTQLPAKLLRICHGHAWCEADKRVREPMSADYLGRIRGTLRAKRERRKHRNGASHNWNLTALLAQNGG